MKKENIREIIIASILGSFFTVLFTWLFSSLFDTLHPILILYSVISALLTITVIIISFHLISSLVDYIKREISTRIYRREIDAIVPTIKKLMEKKEIYMVGLIQLINYIDKRHNIQRREATTDIINKMIIKGILVYIESLKIIILKDKLRCSICNNYLIIKDKVNRLEIECKNEKCTDIFYEYWANGIGYKYKGDPLEEIVFILKLQDLRRLL